MESKFDTTRGLTELTEPGRAHAASWSSASLLRASAVLACVRVCARVAACVRACVFMYVAVCVRVCGHGSASLLRPHPARGSQSLQHGCAVWSCARVRACARVQACVCMYTCACTCASTRARVCVHA
jgi:hypothetical protein